jgi:imidazolonepropionase-like amidohydrolase
VCEVNAALVRKLSAAGAGLLIGTDAGIPAVVCGASVHEEMQAFVDVGLSPYQAVRAATYDAADPVEYEQHRRLQG